MTERSSAPPPPKTKRPVQDGWSRLRDLATYLPAESSVLDAHRDTVLVRTRVAALIAMVVMPVTIFFYMGAHALRLAVVSSVLADAAAGLVLLLTRARFIRDRHYELPFFVLVGVVCSGTNAVLIQLTGGARGSTFLFPYFMILFGVATLFPAKARWAVAAAAMSPLSFFVSEIAAWGELAPGKPAQDLLLLVEVAAIAVIGNRIVTRAFFRELEHRRALELANVRLLEVDRAKRDFFANLSHDLRTPLNIIIGPVEAVLRETDDDAQAHRYLEMALRGARRLEAMINDLLDLARIDSGVAKARLRHEDVRALLAAFVETTEPYAASQGQRLELVTPDVPCIVNGDRDQLERVIANLVSNALKFSPSGATVRIVLHSEADEVRISIEDEGPGVPPEDRDRIFARFDRGAKETRRRARGAGIGLAVVREFVDMHEGRVHVENRDGGGARFVVRLPRVRGVAAASPEDTLPPETKAPASREPVSQSIPLAPRRPRVLLVEDDDESRVFLASELSGSAEVIAASDGESALRLATQRPHVILMDVNLPGLDGFEACGQLRRLPLTSRVPVIMFSADGDLGTRLRAFDAGADDFLHKPLEPLEVRARIDSLLRRTGLNARSGA